MTYVPTICESAPDLRHSVAGDHHGDEHKCVWCERAVVWEQGQWQDHGAWYDAENPRG